MQQRAMYFFSLFITLNLVFSAPLALAQDEEDDFFFSDEEFQEAEIADPLEPLNRISFALNDKLYRLLLSPVIKTYRLIPQPVRISVSNFYNNLTTPVSTINALLQLDLPNAGTEISRFGINSTIGILGIFDPATGMGIMRNNEDFGQTLAHYGIGHGFYLVVPVLGFSSLRDFGSKFGDAYLNPINHVWDPNAYEYIAYKALDNINELSFDVDAYTSLYDSALDPYVFFRSAFVQNRAGAVNQ